MSDAIAATTEPVGFMFDISPALSNLLIAVATGFFGAITAWIAYKANALGKTLEKQTAHIEKVIETTNGINEARIRAEKEASSAKGVLEGRQQVRAEISQRDDPAAGG